jgi:hypothetical protein
MSGGSLADFVNVQAELNLQLLNIALSVEIRGAIVKCPSEIIMHALDLIYVSTPACRVYGALHMPAMNVKGLGNVCDSSVPQAQLGVEAPVPRKFVGLEGIDAAPKALKEWLSPCDQRANIQNQVPNSQMLPSKLPRRHCEIFGKHVCAI